jgi:hypothetical protein
MIDCCCLGFESARRKGYELDYKSQGEIRGVDGGERGRAKGRCVRLGRARPIEKAVSPRGSESERER